MTGTIPTACCGLYYKHVMIVNDDSSVISKRSFKLIDDPRIVIYDCHKFIKQAIGLIRKLRREWRVYSDKCYNVFRHFYTHSINFRTLFQNILRTYFLLQSLSLSKCPGTCPIKLLLQLVQPLCNKLVCFSQSNAYYRKLVCFSQSNAYCVTWCFLARPREN
jgi:hypothetical protein